MYPRLFWIWTFLQVVCSSVTVAGAPSTSWTAEPFNPPSFPLAVRSPYLSCWLAQGNQTALNAAWPTFWTGSILGWAGYVRVDGTVYTFLGDPVVSGATLATQKRSTFTSTQSIFVLTAGGIDLTATFLSPVEPTDLLKQSLPFSYLALTAVSNDGNSHSVQVYTDISAEWTSGDDTLIANWTTTVGNIVTHQAQLQNPVVYQENSDHIQYGSVYYSTQATSGSTYQTGADADVRTQFIQHGTLLNTQDTSYRAVNDRWPIFAHAHDLGTVGSSTSEAAVFSIGHVRDPAIQYIVANSVLQDRSLYFWSSYSSVLDAISFFLGDYSSALSRANAFDGQVSADASSVSTNYAAVAALSIRQAFSATEITISKAADGSWNTDNILIFLKEISSDGNVNTVDVIFPAWPLFLYTNPVLGKYLLSPIFEYQATGQYPNKWSVHDIGSSYPKAIGHNDGRDEAMPLEECGNMIIMTLSHYQRTGDSSLLTTYRSLLDQWTQYLIDEALIPANQISTDDFAGSLANQTNLAIKGIVGIRAMAEIHCILGDQSTSQNYTTIANNYVSQWQQLATSSDHQHLILAYGNDTSWGLSYNLYADRLLGLDLFPQSVYDMQNTWYPTVLETYGVPLDTRHTYTKTDWSIYMAAISTTTSTRDMFIGSIYNYASNGANNVPLSDWYDTTTGKTAGFRARPVVGGHLALMRGLLPSSSERRDTTQTCGFLNVSTPQVTTGSGSSNAGRQLTGLSWLPTLGIAGFVTYLLSHIFI